MTAGLCGFVGDVLPELLSVLSLTVFTSCKASESAEWDPPLCSACIPQCLMHAYNMCMLHTNCNITHSPLALPSICMHVQCQHWARPNIYCSKM